MNNPVLQELRNKIDFGLFTTESFHQKQTYSVIKSENVPSGGKSRRAIQKWTVGMIFVFGKIEKSRNKNKDKK